MRVLEVGPFHVPQPNRNLGSRVGVRTAGPRGSRQGCGPTEAAAEAPAFCTWPRTERPEPLPRASMRRT